jgi:hypothetical protein
MSISSVKRSLSRFASFSLPPGPHGWSPGETREINCGAILADIPQIPGPNAIFGLFELHHTPPPAAALLANPERRFIESRANPVMARVASGSKVRIGANSEAAKSELSFRSGHCKRSFSEPRLRRHLFKQPRARSSGSVTEVKGAQILGARRKVGRGSRCGSVPSGYLSLPVEQLVDVASRCLRRPARRRCGVPER